MSKETQNEHGCTGIHSGVAGLGLKGRYAVSSKTKRRVEEWKKHGLKNPRCMGIYPQT